MFAQTDQAASGVASKSGRHTDVQPSIPHALWRASPDGQSAQGILSIYPKTIRISDTERKQSFIREFEVTADFPPRNAIDGKWDVIIEPKDEHSAVLKVNPSELEINNTNWLSYQKVTISHTGSPEISVDKLDFRLTLKERDRKLDEDIFSIEVDKPYVWTEAIPDSVDEGASVEIRVHISGIQENRDAYILLEVRPPSPMQENFRDINVGLSTFVEIK